MAKYTGNVLTNKGKELLARAIAAGEIITFTKVEIGKGTPIGVKEELEGLIDSFKVLSITSTTKLEGGSYRVRVAFNNAGVLVDTELREVGVFARGEDGVEILYSYCDTDSPDLIPAEDSGTLERVEDIITYISNAATINAIIDQSNVYATIKDLTEGFALKEPKFNKNSGFNLVISHVINSTSKILVASAYAVKLAFDKGLEALGLANTNKNAIQNNTEQIENLYLIDYSNSQDFIHPNLPDLVVSMFVNKKIGIATITITSASKETFTEGYEIFWFNTFIYGFKGVKEYDLAREIIVTPTGSKFRLFSDHIECEHGSGIAEHLNVSFTFFCDKI